MAVLTANYSLSAQSIFTSYTPARATHALPAPSLTMDKEQLCAQDPDSRLPQSEAALAGGVQTPVWLNEWTHLTNVTSAPATCHILYTVQNKKRLGSRGEAIYSK